LGYDKTQAKNKNNQLSTSGHIQPQAKRNPTSVILSQQENQQVTNKKI
jgi:hypothetical protein